MPVPVDISKRVGLGFITLEELSYYEYFGKIAKGLVVYAAIKSKTKREYIVIDTCNFNFNKNCFKLVAEVPLTKYKRGWHPDYTRVDSKYRGMNIALKTYVFIIKNDQLTIRSGVSQSEGSMKLWQQLMKRVVVRAYKSAQSYVALKPREVDLYKVENSFMTASLT